MAQIKNSIFNKKKLKYQIEKVNFNDISDFQNRLELVRKWIDFVNSASFYKSKETELQGNFLFDVFGKVLGYTSMLNNPIEWNLNQEQVTTGGKFADGSLGFYSSGNEIIRVVIELKDANTNLDEKQHRHHDNRTPVEQAFGYQHKIGKDCKWVIVSNFNEIRLYHHSSSIEYEQFFIKDLGEEEKLKRFFFLLGKDNLIAKDGNSAIDSLFISNEQDEQEITKKFYAAFKDIRLKFFDHLKNNNPTIDENILLEKTQKLLDRFIFICFAEDNRLLPETIFKNMVKAAKLAFSYSETKVWTELKGLFNAINIGSPPHNINKFNGGLFAADEVLDSLQIKDQILEELSNITEYDFESDVSIDILGHIFEQSISDLEEIKASINGEVFEKSKSKRKRDGIVYTPAYITRDIVEKAVGGWLEDRKVELGYYDLPELTDEDYKTIINNRGKLTYNDKIKQHLEFWYAYRERLMNIKVLDPACGSGAFLIQVFDFLYAEGNKVNDTIAKLLGGQYEVFQLDKHILSNNIYGVDINSESVEITKLSLWLKTANKNAELTSLDNNIKCGNSLIDDPEVAGDKAFDWNKEFAEIMSNGGFDVVVGNPPYVRADTDNEEFIKQREWLTQNYKTLYEKWDLMTAFFEKGLLLLKEKGYFGFIASNSITTSKFAFRLQDWIINNFNCRSIDYYDNFEIFQNVGVVPVTIIIDKNKLNQNIPTKKIYRKSSFNDVTIKEINFYELKDSTDDEKRSAIFKKEFTKSITSIEYNLLGDICYMSVGMVINADEKKAKGEFDKDDLISEICDISHPKRYVEGKDLKKYKVDKIRFLEWNSDRVPSKIRRPTFQELYEGEKILRGRVTEGIYDDTGIICNDSIVVFKRYIDLNGVNNLSINNSITKISSLKREELESISSKFNLKYILAILNSKYAIKYLNNIRRHRLENYFYPDDFRKLPIANIDIEAQQPYITLADTMLDKNKELQEKNSKFQELLKSDFNIEKLNTKLENWYNLSWSDFELELKKLKITLSGERKDDWIDRYNRYKSQANELQNIIQTTDKKIDQLVYQLYELTEEEIKVVEGE